MARPTAALHLALGGRLHPGGDAATERLLDRAQVGRGTRLVDLGCGAGHAVQLARARGALAWGLDRAPDAEGAACRADIAHLPLGDASLDVALAECAVCLAGDLEAALAESHRVLAPGGRLALSDVVTTRALDEVPAPLARALCLDGERRPDRLRAAIEAAGFQLVHEEDRTRELVATRDALRARVDYDGLLAALGPEAGALLAATRAVDAALDAGEIGYVAMVARKS